MYYTKKPKYIILKKYFEHRLLSYFHIINRCYYSKINLQNYTAIDGCHYANQEICHPHWAHGDIPPKTELFSSFYFHNMNISI